MKREPTVDEMTSQLIDAIQAMPDEEIDRMLDSADPKQSQVNASPRME